MSPTASPSAPRARADWSLLPVEELLDLRLCDLGLRLAGSPLEPRLARLARELAAAGLRFRPRFWISTDWFSPDGVPGAALPFYLFHPRLRRLERARMLEVEGGSEAECMRLLRHETAHALDSAHRLHRRKDWRAVFGRYGEPYPRFYRPRPFSRDHVQHLGSWYAQAHPAEDWAETFATWLDPASRWRERYAAWPALEKLEFVERLMAEIGARRAPVRNRERTEEVSSLRTTLREHYAQRQARIARTRPRFHDQDLLRLFPVGRAGDRRPSAQGFLGRARARLRREVAHWTGEPPYALDLVLRDMAARARDLGLVLEGDEALALRNAAVLLTVQTMNFLHDGHHRLAR